MTLSQEPRFGISISFELIDLFTIADKANSEEEFIKLRDDYFASLALDPRFQGFDYIFPGLKNISLKVVKNIYKEIIKNVDYITPEWVGKMRAIIDITKPMFIDGEVNRNIFSFEYLDKIANFARKHDMKFRMHNIIWHKDFRPIFANASKEEMLKFLDAYTFELNKRYKDVIYAVDVLNEIASDQKGEVLRESKWKDLLGPEYFIDILKIAKKNFTGMPLFYNEYGEERKDKRENILAIIGKIKEKEAEEGITILDGIGIQAHYNAYTQDKDIKEAFLDYSKTGKILQITEFDVSNDGNSNYFDYQTDRVYKTVLENAMLFKIKLFSMWGVSQDISWKSKEINNFLTSEGTVSEYAIKIIQNYSLK